jgi:hypothetical protein
VELIYRFLYVLDSVSHRLSNQEREQLEENYSNLFQERTITVLHAAITNFKVKLRSIRLILRLGDEVTATDEKGQNPYNSFVARFRIQALLSLHRISSQANHGRPCYLYLKSVSKFGSDLVGSDGGVEVFENSRLLILEELSDPQMLSRSSRFDFFVKTLHDL